MSWIWPDYINRDLPLNAPARKAIHRKAWKLWWANGWNLTLHLAYCLVCVLALLGAADFGGRLAGCLGIGGLAHKLTRVGALVGVWVLSAILLRAVLGRCRFAPCVYEATRRHGYEVCARCGYWLKGLANDVARCPECGARRTPMPESD